MICTNQLHSHQIRSITALSKACQEIDGQFIPYYPHILSKPRASSCNILYYQGEQLVGFLSPFFFYDAACEIAIMVAPAYRRQGVARALIAEIKPLLQTEKIKTAIFSASHPQAWLADKGFQYKNSEYQMRLPLQQAIPIENTTCQFRFANTTDLANIFMLDEVCFGKKQYSSAHHLMSFLNHPNNCIIIAESAGRVIGKAHIADKRISDIAVLPELQGQGLGRAMLIFCVNHALTKKLAYLELDVETANKRAINLYTRLGFKVTNVCDFWSKLTDLL